MKELRTEVIIDAPTEKVWNILMDHPSYGEWNPFIEKISGSMEVGKNLEVTIHPPNQKPMNFKPVILKNDAGKEFRWKGKLFFKGLFDGEHYFQLSSVNGTQTKLVHGEKFTGILVGILLKMIGKNTLLGFKEMNSALKIRSEQTV
ncbi:MAG: hypothetical protein ACI837_002310 [Crocinitomicaceae bacterium]|jgi:hypothetical protein